MAEGRKLATDTRQADAQKAEGFCTPTQDKQPQVAHFMRRRVLPVIFLPGIMGSNLKITDKQRQEHINQKDNIAWRPDAIGAGNAGGLINSPTYERQLRLDPSTTDVDRYDPDGKPEASGDGRNSNVSLPDGFDSPLLRDDPPTNPRRRTAVQKARMRGWGEVFYRSYGPLLQMLERRLNNVFVDGKARPEWLDVVGVDPARWMPAKGQTPPVLSEGDLRKATAGCIFPVHAMGYNWLQSNRNNADVIATRIKDVVQTYSAAGFECGKVILVTHSMGGLLARAVSHPDMGGLESDILGIVHGVQPATGAGAAYKRMRAGFEDPGLGASQAQIEASVTAKILGNYGDEVTAVLANAPGGLELLPSKSYGTGWLQFLHQGRTIATLPKGDPYEEIYKLRGKWYSLLREEWINPANLKPRFAGWDQSMTKLGMAKDFHEKIAGYYHPNTYAHYGADTGRLAFGDVQWRIGQNCVDASDWQSWPITQDSRQGQMELLHWQEDAASNKAFKVPTNKAVVPRPLAAGLAAPAEAGDQTVPVRSADDQLPHCKAVFRQKGYEHQGSYKDDNALASTLYCVVRIALDAKWKGC